jgi:Zn finger protein HypA/HybF involved in hydrogenase expression
MEVPMKAQIFKNIRQRVEDLSWELQHIDLLDGGVEKAVDKSVELLDEAYEELTHATKLQMAEDKGDQLTGYSECSSCGWKGIESAKKKVLQEGRKLEVYDLVCPVCGEEGFYED